MDLKASLHAHTDKLILDFMMINDKRIVIRMMKLILIIGVDIRRCLVQNMAGDRCLAVSSHICHTQHVSYSYIDLDIFSLFPLDAPHPS